MEALSLALTSGWASGVNAYATVLVLGLIGRFTDVEQVPAALERTDVLIAAGVLFAIEAVTDKIPYIDSAWDTISTLIRPTVGAVTAALIAGDASTDLKTALFAAAGGGVALVSHLVKASLRLAINGSPEPVSNATASTFEDVTVTGVVALATVNPILAAVIALVVLSAGIVVAILAMRLIRRGLRRFRQFLQTRSRPTTTASAEPDRSGQPPQLP